MATKQEIQEQLIELQEKYNSLQTDLESNVSKLQELEKEKDLWNDKQIYLNNKISDLQDRNTELFLKVNQPIPQETDLEPKEEPRITLGDILGGGGSEPHTEPNKGIRLSDLF